MTIRQFLLIALAVLFAATGALAGSSQKTDLRPPDDALDPDAKGTVKVKVGSFGERIKVKIRKVTKGETFELWLETGRTDPAFALIGEITVSGRSKKPGYRGGGSGKWKLSTKKGDALPLGASSLEDLAGRALQVRLGRDVILEGVLPDATGRGQPDPEAPGPQGPRLRILATDAPFPYADVLSAIVTLDRIEIREAGDGPFETLVSFPGGRDIDLVNLQNGTVRVLFAGDPEPGIYDALRIIVRAKEITIRDGDERRTFTEFKVPSGPQTGIKVFVDPPIAVVTDLTHDLVLDFDMARSYVVQGNPKTPAGIKGFNFKPVIRAINQSTAGTLTFRVRSDNRTPRDTSDDFFVDGAAYELRDASDVVVASGSSGIDPNDPRTHGYVFHPAVPAGAYALEVSYADHDDYLQRTTIYVANLTDLGTIDLRASVSRIEGLVTTELVTTSRKTLTFAVDGASVLGTLKGDPSPTVRDATNARGAFALTDLAAGLYVVDVTKTGYAAAQAEQAPWVAGDPVAAPLEMTLTALTANVTGTVSDTSGPVSGATVRAVVSYGGNDEIIAETTTDALGAYTLAALPTGRYEIRASIDTRSGSSSLEHTGGGAAALVNLTVQ